MGASNSSPAKVTPGSKESPIDIDGEEDPAWMGFSASRRSGVTYGSRLQVSRPRKPVKYDIDEEAGKASKGDEETSKSISLRKGLKKSREAKLLGSSLRGVDLSRDANSNGQSKDGSLFGGSGKSDLETDFTTKKVPAATGSALFDPVSTPSTAIEDHITGAATYANMHTTEKPRVRLPGLKQFTSLKSKGPPGLKVLPGTSPGHAFTSSTPALNRTPTYAVGRTSPTLVDVSSTESSESESDDKPDDLLSSGNNELDASQYAPLQPTRDAPPPPPSYSATNSNVIELDGSDNDTISDSGSVKPPVINVQTLTQVLNMFKENRQEQIGDGDNSGGGVPLPTPEQIVTLLNGVTSNGEKKKEKEKDSDGDEKMDTPPSHVDEEENVDVPEDCVRFEVYENHNPDHTIFVDIPLTTPYHVFCRRVATGMGWHGVSGTTFRLTAIKDATRWQKKQKERIKGDNWNECLQWINFHTPNNEDTSEVYMLVSDQASETPNYLSIKDKERESDRIDEEMAKFKVPQIFGGDRPTPDEVKVVPLDALPLDKLSDVVR